MQKLGQACWVMIALLSFIVICFDSRSLFATIIFSSWLILLLYYAFFAKFYKRSRLQKLIVMGLLPFLFLHFSITPDWLIDAYLNIDLPRVLRAELLYFIQPVYVFLLISPLFIPIIYKVLGHYAPFAFILIIALPAAARIDNGIWTTLLSLCVAYLVYDKLVSKKSPEHVIIRLSLLELVSRAYRYVNSTYQGGARQVYSPNQIYLGAILGGPIACCFFLRQALKGIGKTTTANAIFIVGMLLLVVVVLVELFNSFNVDMSPISLGYFIVTFILLKIYYLTKSEIGMSDDYVFESNWKVLVLSVLFIGLTMGLMAVISYIYLWYRVTFFFTV